MKASCAWLRSLLPGLEASVDELAERLTRSGLEVEEIIEYGAATTEVVVAEVVGVETHPKRERLSLVTVNYGSGQQTVVCGASNVPAAGGKVALARVGTTLPAAGLTVGSRELGGVLSEGMLCSEEELGLIDSGGKGAGILVLEADAEVGACVASALAGSHDFVLDIGVTPNRPDALGHVGLARELGTLFELPFAPPEPEAPARVAPSLAVNDVAAVEIADLERCPHYGAAVVVDIKQGPSPSWLRYRLESLGVRAISNVVDVTNLVLLEFGHPTHAFDLDKLSGGKIVVRRAAEGEPLTTLDGVERKLVADDLVITTGERPVALAGVMGGADSEIDKASTRVLVESAYFAPRGIRRSARRHGLHSEASHRFERGCDPAAVPAVLAHTASLLTHVCGGAAVKGLILAGTEVSPAASVRLRMKRLEALLGLALSAERATQILSRLGCEVRRSEGSADELEVVAPSYRPDLGREEDLIEEVMRIHGIDEVPATGRAVLAEAGRSQPSTSDRLRRIAAGLGLSEALCYGFVSPVQLEAVGAPAAAVVLQNPLTEERSVMRTSLLPGLLEALRRARRHGVPDVRLFSVGACFLAGEAEAELPREKVLCTAVLAGSRQLGLEKPQPLDVYDAKGVAVELIERLLQRRADVRSIGDELSHLHPRGAGELLVDGQRVGTFGPLHPRVLDTLDLDGDALAIELDVAVLQRLGQAAPQYRPIPVLPAASRDLAFVVADAVLAGEVEAAIVAAAGELCESVALFDQFRGKGVPDEHQSLAFRLVFRDPKAATDPQAARTLTDREVDAQSAAVMAAVVAQYGASVRGA